MNLNWLSCGTCCYNSWELSPAVINADASKFSTDFSVSVEFALGIESWG